MIAWVATIAILGVCIAGWAAGVGASSRLWQLLMHPGAVMTPRAAWLDAVARW